MANRLAVLLRLHINWRTPVALGQYTIEAIAYDAAGHQTQTPMVTVNAKEMGTGNLSCDIKQIYREDGTECMVTITRAVSSVITPHGVLVKRSASVPRKRLPWEN